MRKLWSEWGPLLVLSVLILGSLVFDACVLDKVLK